jgi:hypothetical protein
MLGPTKALHLNLKKLCHTISTFCDVDIVFLPGPQKCARTALTQAIPSPETKHFPVLWVPCHDESWYQLKHGLQVWDISPPFNMKVSRKLECSMKVSKISLKF